MLTKPGLLAVRSLHVLVRMNAWEAVSQCLDAELQAVYANLVTSQDPVQLHELRGRAKFILEFQKLCSETGPLLEKLEKAPPQR